MIIGNNGFNGNNFENKFKRYNENGEIHKNKNVFVKDIKQTAHSNINSKDDMYDKTLAMLHDRLSQGLISLEEFNRKCAELSKLRRK